MSDRIFLYICVALAILAGAASIVLSPNKPAKPKGGAHERSPFLSMKVT